MGWGNVNATLPKYEEFSNSHITNFVNIITNFEWRITYFEFFIINFEYSITKSAYSIPDFYN